MEYKITKLVQEDYDTIQGEETVKDAITKFSKKSRPRTLLVFNEENEYIGVVTERNILRSGNNASGIKIKHLVVKAPKLEKDSTIFEAAKTMLDCGMKHLPVFDGESILGIIRANDVLEQALLATNIGELDIRRFMTATPLIVQHDDKISTVMNMFNDLVISRVPVMKDGKPIGMVSKHDIVTKILLQNNTLNFNEFGDEKNTVWNNTVEAIMNYPLKTLTPESKTQDVIQLMKENGFNSVVITDEEEKLRGIVTKKDLLQPIAALIRGSEQKRYIQLRGQTADLEPHVKAEIINSFEELLKKHDSMEEAHAFVYIKKHKGRLNKGKARGVDMYYIRARVNSDMGTYVASTEEYGVTQTANEVVRLLDKQIKTSLSKSRNRVKGEEVFAVKAAV